MAQLGSAALLQGVGLEFESLLLHHKTQIIRVSGAISILAKPEANASGGPVIPPLHRKAVGGSL